MSGIDGDGGAPTERLGVMGALDAEVSALRQAMNDARTSVRFGVRVISGTLDGWPVVLAESGVGKVNAALATAAMIDAGASRIVFVGVAGSLVRQVGIGDLVVATDLVQHDVDVTALGHPVGQLLGEPTAWPTDAVLSTAIAAAASGLGLQIRVHRGRIASGDQFIADAVRGRAIAETFAALAAEMEGAAVAQACAHAGVPCAIVRWVSDSCDHSSALDFPVFLQRAAVLDCALIRALLTQTPAVGSAHDHRD